MKKKSPNKKLRSGLLTCVKSLSATDLRVIHAHSLEPRQNLRAIRANNANFSRHLPGCPPGLLCNTDFVNLRAQLHHFTYYLFPGQCILCKNLTYRQLDLCLACELDLPWLRNCCPYCAEPSADLLPCAECLQKPPNFSATLIGFEYRFPINALVHAFKDSRHLASGYVLTHLAYSRHRQTLSNISGEDLLVVPVPLHPRKSRARGFNQSHLIAEQLANLIPAKLDQTLLYRVIDTPDQKSLPLASRKHNLKNSFEVKRDLKGNRILLVDDVVTTGATITEISLRLLQSGASDVVVFAVARTPPPKPIMPGLLQ